jgi:hypothetical protein
MRPLIRILALGALVGGATPAATQSAGRTLTALRATAPIIVDGVLDEADWARAAVARDFTQSDPDEGRAATERTEVRILYDEQRIYVGAFLHHRVRADIVVNELRKDFDGSSTDYFAVIFDTFHDRRNGYQFGVNPRGARWDSQKFNEGRERNLNWDGEWVVRTHHVADGWYAEFAIPFRTMQMPDGDAQRWGLNFVRHLQGRLEDSFWAPVPRQYHVDRLSLAGTLEGIRDIPPAANLRLKPYVAGVVTRQPPSAAPTAPAPTLHREALGLDAKYALTSGLSLDLTANTDFSEVEADEQQLARSRSALFFPEKREFFLDNSGVFQFGPGAERAQRISSAAGTSAAGRDNAVQNDLILLFTRRIGLSAEGEPIPLAGGARVSGHAGDLTLGAMAVRQRAHGATPATDFGVLRLRRNLGGSSDIGLMVLDRERRGSSDRVAGADAHLQLSSALSVFGYAAVSNGGGASDTLGAGHAARAGFRWRDGRWELESSGSVIGGRFSDPVGFVPQSGVVRQQYLLGRRFRPAHAARWLRAIEPMVGLTDSRHEAGGFDARYWELRVPVTFRDGTILEIGANPNDELLTEPFTANADRGLTVAPGRYRFTDGFVSLATARARRAYLSARVSSGAYYDGRRTVAAVNLHGRINPHLATAVGVIRDRTQLAAGAATSTLITARLNVGFTTNAFLNAIAQYNSDADLLSANIRLHVIHRPLSDLFVVVNTRAHRGMAAADDGTVAVKFTRSVAF